MLSMRSCTAAIPIALPKTRERLKNEGKNFSEYDLDLLMTPFYSKLTDKTNNKTGRNAHVAAEALGTILGTIEQGDSIRRSRHRRERIDRRKGRAHDVRRGRHWSALKPGQGNGSSSSGGRGGAAVGDWIERLCLPSGQGHRRRGFCE